MFASRGFIRPTAPNARPATWRTGNSQGKLLSAYEINQAWPGAPKGTKTDSKRHKEVLFCASLRPLYVPFVYSSRIVLQSPRLMTTDYNRTLGRDRTGIWIP